MNQVGGGGVAKVMKHKKDLASLKMLEDEAITFYAFSVVVSSIFEGKKKTNSYIAYLQIYVKWMDNTLQTGLGCDLEKMLDPIHWDIKLITTKQYQFHMSLKARAAEMALRSVEFVSYLVCWVCDT